MFLPGSHPLPVCQVPFYPTDIGWTLMPTTDMPTADFDSPSTDNDKLGSQLHPPRPPDFAKRRRETFCNGRRAAFKALRKVGFLAQPSVTADIDSIDPESISEEQLLRIVGRNADRSPHWPVGFVGSISHSAHWILAAAARLCHYQSIGIDTEVIVTKQVAESLRPDIGAPDEWQLIEDLGIEQASAFTLLFSAKEAFYKCWYPLQKSFLDFLEVRAHQIRPNLDSSRVDTNHGEIELQLVGTACSEHRTEYPKHQISVRYCITSNDVFTLAFLKNEQAHKANHMRSIDSE